MSKVPIGAVYIYRVNFFAGFIVACAVYYLLCYIKPVLETSSVWCERGEQADSLFSYKDGTASSWDEDGSTAAYAESSSDEEKETEYRDGTKEGEYSVPPEREESRENEERGKTRRLAPETKKRSRTFDHTF